MEVLWQDAPLTATEVAEAIGAQRGQSTRARPREPLGQPRIDGGVRGRAVRLGQGVEDAVQALELYTRVGSQVADVTKQAVDLGMASLMGTMSQLKSGALGSDEAIAFIRQPRDKPFFLNWWPFSVHSAAR